MRKASLPSIRSHWISWSGSVVPGRGELTAAAGGCRVTTKNTWRGGGREELVSDNSECSLKQCLTTKITLQSVQSGRKRGLLIHLLHSQWHSSNDNKQGSTTNCFSLPLYACPWSGISSARGRPLQSESGCSSCWTCSWCCRPSCSPSC